MFRGSYSNTGSREEEERGRSPKSLEIVIAGSGSRLDL